MRVLIAILVLSMCMRVAVAGGMLDRNTTGDGVTVSIASPFSDLPPGGYVPYQVSIRNDRSSSETWRVCFQASATISSSGPTYYQRELSVAPNATGIFDVLVPLPVVSERGNLSLMVGVNGPGFRNSAAFGQFFTFIYSSNCGSSLPFCLIGDNVLGPSGTGPLESYYKDISETYYGSDLEAERIPSDWRAFSGVARIILRDTEWLGLSSAQRGAIGDYVAQGGRLLLLTSDNLDSRTPQLQLPTADGKAGGYGFGQIAIQTVASFPPDVSFLANVIEHDGANQPRQVDSAFSIWDLRDRIGTIAVHSGFVFCFVVLFGALVGPVNLFVFARGNNRFRLFWTTPFISLVASAALIVGILLTDGLGGSGRQLIAVFSLPDIHREAVIQEQIARTAVLFSNQWHSDQDYAISPVSVQALDNAASAPGYRAYSPHQNLASSADTYLQIGNSYSGNWFRSRSVSGQYLQAVRPSRSAVTVLNAPAVNLGHEAPAILSSFPDTLSRLYLIDNQGQVWTCDNVVPGARQTCVPGNAQAYSAFWTDACEEAGGKLRPLLSGASNRPGCFYATGLPESSEALATLGEVRWRTEKGLYLGPWVASSTAENGP